MTLTKDSTRKEFEEELRKILFKTLPEREFVIYVTPQMREALDKAIDEEFKKLTKNDIRTNTHV